MGWGGVGLGWVGWECSYKTLHTWFPFFQIFLGDFQLDECISNIDNSIMPHRNGRQPSLQSSVDEISQVDNAQR